MTFIHMQAHISVCLSTQRMNKSNCFNVHIVRLHRNELMNDSRVTVSVYIHTKRMTFAAFQCTNLILMVVT